ncbi:AAA family ATPase [Candidatus Dependentiae bacterium]|nr:AAA family ATPase [Candidatus Dependentiae bacterium]
MRNLSLNIQTFSQLIEGDCIYIDKTEIIHRLIKQSKTCFFSRPRRFGKSLVVSTLESIFRGKKELFENLAISKTDYDWKEYPIVKLDFGTLAYENPDQLKFSLCLQLKLIAQEYGIEDNFDYLTEPSNFIAVLFPKLARNNKIVFLVDEYDKPILDHIENMPVAHAIRDVLQKFYSSIKGNDQYIHFMFVTGVSKFSQTALFSGFNNLDDLSQHPKAAELVGYTKQEIERYFTEYLDWTAKSMGYTHEELMNQISQWYDGYRFTLETEFEMSAYEKKTIQKIYSPVSVMKFLDRRRFSNYWFETGTPTYLVKAMRSGIHDTSWIDCFTSIKVDPSMFGSFNLERIPFDALLYQAGYLTIKSYDEENKLVELAYPNLELKNSMESYLLSAKCDMSETRVAPVIAQLRVGLKAGDIEPLANAFKILLANVPYQLHIEQEGYYHSIFQTALWILGSDVQSEVCTDTGRADLVVRTNDRIFVFEFKFNKPAQEAMDQILEKRYYEKYQHESKPILLVGLSFNYKAKKLTVEYLTQAMNF